MISALEEYILDRWKDLLSDHEKPSELSFILISDLPPHMEVVSFLIVPKRGFEPLLTAKIPRYISNNGKLRKKVECVCSLKEQLPTHLSCSIPAVINMTEIDGRLIILEQPVPLPTVGLKVKRSVKPGPFLNRIGGLGVIGDWLSDFFTATRQPTAHDSLSKRILSSLDEYEDRFFPEPLQKEWLDKMRLKLTKKEYIPYGGVVHTNLTPDQVSFHRQQLYISNWENMVEKGLPLLDPFHFVTSLALHGVRKVTEPKDRFRLAVLDREGTGILWSSWLNKLCTALRIDETTRNLLYAFYLVDQALNWNEFETVENYWPQLFGVYASWFN
jgi:hypothetical protein